MQPETIDSGTLEVIGSFIERLPRNHKQRNSLEIKFWELDELFRVAKGEKLLRVESDIRSLIDELNLLNIR